jgi:pimeloyl-ACP methyl ester carboxylesterase
MDKQTHRVPLTDGRVIHVSDQGIGPVVVLLHGIPGSAVSWAEVATRLASRHRVLVPDLIGFGESSRSTDVAQLHAQGQADAVTQALDAMSVAKATFVGHDFGGPVALSLWARAPGRFANLGLLATNTFTDTPIPFPLSATTWPVLGGLARAALFSAPSLRMMLRRGVGTPKITVDPAAAVGDARQAAAIATIFSNSLLRLAELYGPIERALSTVSVPTFVAWGDRDPFFSVEHGRRTAGAIRGAQFQLLERAGHFLPEERPEEISALIENLPTA